ncbi:MAG: RsmB/NOP family class I SAM-dependent RNA methyltransferase [Clostridia bacterium]|nr:RsmB/NOP family class I SAM-dependent RNA methyltransferase [Clostridia bacterium]
MKLPLEFLNKMKNLLGIDEYTEFINSFNDQRYYGLRVNTLKTDIDDFIRKSPFRLERVPWTRDGYYYSEGDSPGRHPYYHAGLYYIQEPSAMLPGEVIDAQPGEYILDMCAAPGGKTVQIAAGMKGQGLLVANDINSDRVKALVKNIELCGIKNAIVTNETPEKLANNFRGFFNKILVDAPCSGEGMFRKDEEAARSWKNFKCEKCAGMQWEILQYADKMLKPGGYIVYSTCTFSPEEDEKMVLRFLDSFGYYDIVEIAKVGGIEPGRPEWADGSNEFKKTARLWPHRLKGEGHFVAHLKKKEDYNYGNNVLAADKADYSKISNKETESCLKAFRDFENEYLNTNINGCFELKGTNLYCLPVEYPDLSGLKIAKFGWYLGEYIRGKFEPSHSMVISLKKEDIKNTVDFASTSREIISYLKGETLMIDGSKGYTGILADGYTVGWGKQTGDILKNLYPKGWRKMS